VQQERIVVTQLPPPPPHTPATRVDGPVHHESACSVTNEAIAEIRRVDDSFQKLFHLVFGIHRTLSFLSDPHLKSTRVSVLIVLH